MQAGTRITLGFTLTAMCIIGVYGLSQLRQEDKDLRLSATRDLQLMGQTVQVALGNALRDRQTKDIREMLDVVKLPDHTFDFLVFDARGTMIAESLSGTDLEDLAGSAVVRAQATHKTQIDFEGPRGLGHLVGAFPIKDDDGSDLGTLAVVRSLDDLRDDLASETRSTFLSLLSLVVGLAAAGWLMAWVYVRGPLQKLVETMRAVRRGDLSAKAAPRRDDEIGTAVGEFNALVADLGEAHRRLLAEAEAREVLEMNLRRADRLVTVGQLAAGLAHEIGSPLQILNGRARALAARTELPADARRIAGILANESDRVTRIVEQLLTFSRRSAPRSTSAQLEDPVGDIVELFEANARRHQVRLEFTCDPDLPEAVVDVGQVQQVVINLVSNAVRAAGASGGRVGVTLKPSSFFAPEAAAPCPSVSLVVEDTGGGIPPDLLPHIFEPFFTTHAEAGGTGLGLAVVKSIVDSHGGTIAVTTRPGGGTRFTVHFPISRGATVAEGIARS